MNIESLEINEGQKAYLRNRWLNQLNWFKKKAHWCKRWHINLRLIVIIGGFVIPVAAPIHSGVASVVGAVVATSAAIEEVFQFGDQWTRYRIIAESLKTEGWLFSQLAGHYSDSHSKSYRQFVEATESLLSRENETFARTRDD